MHTVTKLLSSFVGHLKPDRAKARALSVLTLPEPDREGGMPLLSALARRQSGREFAETELPLPLLSNLLWSAFGINRPDTGGRTAPSAMNAQEVDVYVARPDGLYHWARRVE